MRLAADGDAVPRAGLVVTDQLGDDLRLFGLGRALEYAAAIAPGDAPSVAELKAQYPKP